MSDAIEKLTDILQGYIKPMRVESAAEAILAAIQADPMAYVKVKPLEWAGGVADSAAGRYVIESVLASDGVRKTIWAHNPDESDLFYMYQHGEGAENGKAAQAAAQTHFESQWKECIA